MNNVFITRSNMKKLERESNATQRDIKHLITLYGIHLGNLLSTPELRLLCETKLVLETINESYDLISTDFSKLRIKPSRMPQNSRWIYLGGSPAYHKNINCPRLHQDYINFEIPSSIPENKIGDYRDFFLKNIALLYDDPERFYVRISTKFRLTTQHVRSVRFDNTGFDERKNFNINPGEAFQKIQTKISSMLHFKDSTPEIKKIISRFGFATHKAKDFKTQIKYIDMQDDNPIKWWHNSKQELKGYILDHIISTTNPDLEFNKSVLDHAGFYPCKECYNPEATTGNIINM